MRPFRRAATILVAALASLACSAAPQDTGFPLAYFHDDCAPWDGRALTLVLTHSPMTEPFAAGYPFARVTSYRPPSRLAGSTVSWKGAAQDDGYATLCDSEEECVTARSVRVWFDRASDEEGTLAGDLRLELDDGRLVEGTFEAHRIAHTMLCG